MVDESDPSQVVRVHKRTGLRFPPTMGAYTIRGIREFEEPGLGTVVTYDGPGVEQVDVYLYDLGEPSIPEGTGEEVHLRALGDVVRGLGDVVRKGEYCDHKLHVTERIFFGKSEATAISFLHAFISYRFGPDVPAPFTGDMQSHFLICGLRGMLLKLRLSHPADDGDAAGDRFGGFMDALLGSPETRH
jgi:hypothetical protein